MRDRGRASLARAARVRKSPRRRRRRSHARCGRANAPPRGPAPACRRCRGRTARQAAAGRRCGPGASRATRSTTADRTGPRPPPSCRRHGDCQLSPSPTAAAMPPCAQALEPDRPGLVPASTRQGMGASFRAVNRPAMPAPKISAPSVSTILSMRFMFQAFTASMRSIGAFARAATSAGTITSWVMVCKAVQNAVQRDALHVRAEIAGPHEFHVRILDRDIVAHRAFGDHHHAAGRCCRRHSRSWPRSSRRNRLPPPLRAGIRDGPAP